MYIFKMILDLLTVICISLLAFYKNAYVYAVALVISIVKLVILVMEERKRNGKR